MTDSTANGDYFVHESSYVDEGAQIGAGTSIWHFCHIMSGARIGERCSLGQNVNVAGNVVVGDDCRIQNNVSLYSGVTLADDVFCGPSCVFTNDKLPRAAYPSGPEGWLPTLVRQGASIGANATIVCGTIIGVGALIGSGAVVTHDVPDYAVMLGVPARQSGWICECGVLLQLDGDLPQKAICPSCGRRYDYNGKLLKQEQSA
jgi:UDP-2-acetamido-3-amino-2,3-dideoxy-glucuronate N-acetyltransferase